ncbi:hypothetical protein BRARA_F01674 [Brassica rapa]|uniref:No apical meristem-associated C-terminal domain-containing protein n=1 Tax=Brassica campestris TaxID=3711 RepID=A0A397YY25_BRACM|nr:hypothetical protein BRARA_F01674 [Brassica rapa]
MDPYTQNCSFQNLLNSQNPYQSVPREPTVEVSASDASMLGSPWNEDVDDDVEILSDRKERRKWTLTEDVVLISAWLNTSKDPVVGNEQKAVAFWKRIAAYFAATRWGKINEGVCKFVGCYEAATKQRSSGQNENDVLKLAHMIFFNDHKDEPMARPEGVKAAKAKGKNPGSKQATSEAEQKEKIEFQSFWEIRQSDFALKATLNKQKLLEGLINKSEPLTELEIEFKNKLLREILG